MRPRAELAAPGWKRARSFALVVTTGALLSLLLGCASEPDTLRLLDQPDSGTGNSTCRKDADCDRNLPYCDLDEHRCVECSSASQCASGLSCSQATHSCSSRCLSSDDCDGIDRQICGASGACVQCEADLDCTGSPATPHCNQQSGLCVECVTQVDCGPTSCFDDCRTCVDSKCVWRT
jgi:hypothetical protein